MVGENAWQRSKIAWKTLACLVDVGSSARTSGRADPNGAAGRWLTRLPADALGLRARRVID
jgi:hypothetical protein